MDDCEGSEFHNRSTLMLWMPVALSVAVEPVVTDDPTIASLFVHSHGGVLSRMCGVRDCEFGDRC